MRLKSRVCNSCHSHGVTKKNSKRTHTTQFPSNKTVFRLIFFPLNFFPTSLDMFSTYLISALDHAHFDIVFRREPRQSLIFSQISYRKVVDEISGTKNETKLVIHWGNTKACKLISDETGERGNFRQFFSLLTYNRKLKINSHPLFLEAVFDWLIA